MTDDTYSNCIAYVFSKEKNTLLCIRNAYKRLHEICKISILLFFSSTVKLSVVYYNGNTHKKHYTKHTDYCRGMNY